MLIFIGLVLGIVVGLVLAAAAWASGRRPYLRVDITQHVQTHSTTTIVHRSVDPAPAISEAPVPAFPGRVLARAVLPHPMPRGLAALPARKEIDQ